MTIDLLAEAGKLEAEKTEEAFQIAICFRKRYKILPLQDHFRNMQVALDYFSSGSIMDYLAEKNFTEEDIKFMNMDPYSFFCCESIGYNLQQMDILNGNKKSK